MNASVNCRIWQRLQVMMTGMEAAARMTLSAIRRATKMLVADDL
jgi:uridine phosphorylase